MKKLTLWKFTWSYCTCGSLKFYNGCTDYETHYGRITLKCPKELQEAHELLITKAKWVDEILKSDLVH